MDTIIRKLVKERESGFKQQFDFTTYSFIFQPEKWPDCKKIQAVFRMLQNQFLTGLKGLPNSPSKMPELIVKTEKIDSPFCELARKANYRGAGNRQHKIVQDYLMRNHEYCIAVELPLWYDDIEGFADFLLMNPDPFMLCLPDFKPDAHKEKKAATQLIHLERGLLNLTGGAITQDDIELVYFDDTNAYKVIR